MANAATDPSADCPFCNLPELRIVHANALAVVVRDSQPVAPEHALVIPSRHVESFFKLLEDERRAMLSLLQECQAELWREFAPDGYAIGINDGRAAGQAVPHVHLHVVPRRDGDVEDPRGGIRWVLSDKARYWP